MAIIKLFEQWLTEAGGDSEETCGGLDPYAGGTEKTPSGQGNEFTNNKFGIKMSDLCKFAKENNLPTENNTVFQKALYSFIEKANPSVIEKMWDVYKDNKASIAAGKRNADTYADGMLGARTLFLIQQTVKKKPPVPTVNLSIQADYQFMDVGRTSQRRAKIWIWPNTMTFDPSNTVNIKTWVETEYDSKTREERGARVKNIVIFPNTVDDHKVYASGALGTENGYTAIELVLKAGMLTGGAADYAKPDYESGRAYLISRNEYYDNSWLNKKQQRDITDELLSKKDSPEELRKYLVSVLTPAPPAAGSSDEKSGKDPFVKKPQTSTTV